MELPNTGKFKNLKYITNHSERCPICRGTGKLTVDYQTTTSDNYGNKVCNGCNGRGWITVSDWAI